MLGDYGYLDKGWESNANNHSKKLFKQMDDSELDMLTKEITDIEGLSYHPHLQLKIDTGEVWFDDEIINHTIQSDNLSLQIREYGIIKLPCGFRDDRVLIRSENTTFIANGNQQVKYSLMFVVSLNTHEIITAYYISSNIDFDDTNMERYDESIDIIHNLKSDKRIVSVHRNQQTNDELSIDDWLDIFDP